MKKILLTVVTVLSIAMLADAQFESSFTRQAELMNEDFVNRRNKVAVLPLTYIGNGHESREEEMRFYLQDIAIDFLNRSTLELKVLDAAEINSLLRKNGINEFDLRAYSPGELAKILHVEYVVMGTVLQDLGREVTVYNDHSHNRERMDRSYKDPRRWEREHTHGASVTRQNIETSVSLSIYNQVGNRIYSGSRQSILSGPGAYRNTMHYMLKRSPLYNR